MIVEDIYELSVVGVYDRNIPNKERIVLRANETVNIGQYGLMVGIRGMHKNAFPIRDNLLWFGDGLLDRDDWIFVYTGPGDPTSTDLPNTQSRIYSVHWARKNTIFSHPDLLPILFRVDAIALPSDSHYLSEQKA